MFRFSPGFAALTIASVLCPTNEMYAQPPDDSASTTRFVLRISRQFIRDRVMPTIEDQKPVNRILFGAYVTGVSDTTGKTSVVMDINEDDAVFTISLKGTSVNRTVASRRPVQVYSTGTTTYEASRIIRFDGTQFIDDPAKIEATHVCVTDGIATPPGLRGLIARNAATRRIRETRAACDAIALNDAKTHILASFKKETDRLLKDLNGLMPVQKTLALFSSDKDKHIMRLKSTKEFLIISPGMRDEPIAELPREWVRMKAPVELWIRGDPDRTRVRGLVELWTTLGTSFDKLVPTKAKKDSKVERFALTAAGEWWVLKFGEELVEELLDKKEGGKVETNASRR